MAGYDVRAPFFVFFGDHERDHFVQRIDDAVDVAAFFCLDHRVTDRRKQFAGTEHLRVTEKYHRVAIGVRRGHVVEEDRLVAVESATLRRHK